MSKNRELNHGSFFFLLPLALWGNLASSLESLKKQLYFIESGGQKWLQAQTFLGGPGVVQMTGNLGCCLKDIRTASE